MAPEGGTTTGEGEANHVGWLDLEGMNLSQWIFSLTRRVTSRVLYSIGTVKALWNVYSSQLQNFLAVGYSSV